MPVKSRTARPRGRPARIDRERIVDAAIDIGLDVFALDDIAGRLGVTTPALYRHVEGRDDIVRAAAAAVIVALEPELRVHDRWDAWLRAWATGIRDRLGAVGEEVLEAVRLQVGAEALRVADHGLRLLVDAGLRADEAAYSLWLVLRVACTAGPAAQPSVTGPLAQVLDETPPSPAMADAIATVADDAAADTWRFDLDVIIAGLGARLDD
ncbi:MAG: TetR/AcrR family transcriptional regulator C-terminal domain-containing protein [Actinomycetota bacterium]